jgi:hypothetical protein
VKKVTKSRKLLQALLFLVSIGSMLLYGCSSSGATTQYTTTSTYTPPTYATVTSSTPITSETTSASKARVSIVSSVDKVKPGETFDVFVRVDSVLPTRGVQFTIKWDPNKAECTSVEMGDYYQTVAKEHGGEIIALPSSLKPDNAIGQFPSGVDPIYKTSNAVAVAIAGAIAEDGTLIGPTGTGKVIILHMLSRSESTGDLKFDLSNVVLKDNSKPSVSMETEISGTQITLAAG